MGGRRSRREKDGREKDGRERGGSKVVEGRWEEGGCGGRQAGV